MRVSQGVQLTAEESRQVQMDVPRALSSYRERTVYPFVTLVDSDTGLNVLSEEERVVIDGVRCCAQRSTTLRGRVRETVLHRVGRMLAAQKGSIRMTPSRALALACFLPALAARWTVFR